MKFIKILGVLIFLSAVSVLAQPNVDQLENLIENGKYLEARKLASEIPSESENYKLWILAGDVYHELQDYKLALDAYKKAFDINDDEVQSYSKLGRAYSMTDNYEKSVEIIEEGMDDFDDNIELHLQLAQTYIREGKFTDAEVMINRAEDIDEDDPTVYVARGDMYFDQRVFELAKNNYEKALELDQNLLDARENLAICYYWLGMAPNIMQDLKDELITMSLKEWDRLTKQDSMNASAFFNKGKILYLAGKHKDAVPALYRYYELRPDASLGRWYLGQSLYEVGLCDSAAPQLRYSAENIDSVKNKANLLLARCYYENKNYEKAKAAYFGLMTAGETPLESRDYRWFGTSQLISGDTTEAIKTYKDIVQKDPQGSCNLMMLVGRLMVSAKRYDESIYFLERKLETDCQDSTKYQEYYYLGLAYLFNKNIDKAIENLEMAIEADSTNPSPYIYLGDAYASEDSTGSLINEDKAVDLFKKAIEKSKIEPEANKGNIRQAYFKLTGLYYGKKDWENLKNAGIEWTKAQPKVIYSYIYTAVGFQGLGNQPKACEYYNKALEIDPNNNVAKQNKTNLGC